MFYNLATATSSIHLWLQLLLGKTDIKVNWHHFMIFTCIKASEMKNLYYLCMADVSIPRTMADVPA